MGNTALRLCLVAMWLAGCGKVSDGAAIDAGRDAELDGNATVVTHTALFGGTPGAPAGNIDIVSNLPNNMILALAQTDASGNATIPVYPGGSVTAVYKHTFGMGADLITWAGVMPGDTLTFGNRQPSLPDLFPSLGTQTYSWPALANATAYDIYTSCENIEVPGTTTSASLIEIPPCHHEPMEVLFRAFNGRTLIGYNFRSDIAFTDGATVSIASWITTIPTGTINITGLPPEVTSVYGSFNTVLNSTRLLSLDGYVGPLTGGAFSATFPWNTTGERTVGILTLLRPGFADMQLFDSLSASTLTQTVASPALPPWAQGSTIASSALRMASWFLVADTSSTYDGQLLHLTWGSAGAGSVLSSQWDIILPPGSASIMLPTLPPSLSDLQPVPAYALSGLTTAFDISSVMGYDMLRKQPSANVMCLKCAVAAGDFQRVVSTQF